jgi:AcrR family transcriptional regulator
VKTERTDSDAYQRILATARDLFYRNCYRATGINEIIEKSGVAKATFYAHFPSKDQLAFAYVKSMNEIESRSVALDLERHRGPTEKLIGLMEFLIPWSQERDYRGCTYLNIASEVPDTAHPVHQETRRHYDTLRDLVGGLVKELKAARGRAWKQRDADQVAGDYLLIFAGALALGQVYHDPKPLRQAVEAAKRLLA